MTGEVTLAAASVEDFAARLFEAAGISRADAALTARDLVAADLNGIGSHGVMLLPMYIARLKAGSVARSGRGQVVSDRGSAIVIDAGNSLGQVAAHHAVELVASRARQHGLAAVTIRNAFHFGAAGHYARMIAARGAVGIVMSNTRPLMPAMGGAEAMVGNNPIAIALPTSGAHPVDTDMAMSASAMGRIRIAAAEGLPIPEGWAVDKQGHPTTDAAQAISGMLLPAAGPKGFGLAFMIDLLCGGLSGGQTGAGVQPLYGDPAKPYACAQMFLAIDVEHFSALGAFEDLVRDRAAEVSASKTAPGVEKVFAPGELTAATRASAHGRCKIDGKTHAALLALAAEYGLDATELRASAVEIKDHAS